MDHAGSAETADPIVRIGVYDPSWSSGTEMRRLRGRLLSRQRTKWASREEQYRYGTSSRNLEFMAKPTTADLEKAEEIILPVEVLTPSRS